MSDERRIKMLEDNISPFISDVKKQIAELRDRLFLVEKADESTVHNINRLSGGTDKQTEKKEVCLLEKPHASAVHVEQRLIKACQCPIHKASGGDKSVMSKALDDLDEIYCIHCGKQKEKLPELPCNECKTYISKRCVSCIESKTFDKFKPMFNNSYITNLTEGQATTEPEKYWTKEEWDDLCSICNPQDVMESIDALRKHDNKLIEGFLRGLKGLIVEDDMEYFPKFQKNKYDQLIKEYEGMLK